MQNYLKILYFSGDNQFFRILLGIKSPYAGVKLVHLLTREEISANLFSREATGALGQGVLIDCRKNWNILLFKEAIKIKRF